MTFVLNDHLVPSVPSCASIFDLATKICKIAFCVKKKAESESSCFTISGISIFSITVLCDERLFQLLHVEDSD